MGRKPQIIPALPEHISTIVACIREDDLRELALLSCGPDALLRMSLRTAFAAWTGTVDGVPICMFGVSSGEIGEGRPWMIGTKDLDRFAFLFLRRCRPQVERMLAIRSVLANYVSVDNTRAIEWLRWLGFEFSEPIKYGPKGGMFRRFELRRRQ